MSREQGRAAPIPTTVSLTVCAAILLTAAATAWGVWSQGAGAPFSAVLSRGNASSAGGMVTDGSVSPVAAARGGVDLVSYLGDLPLEVQPTLLRVGLPVEPDELRIAAELVCGGDPNEPEPLARSRMVHAARLSKLRGVPPPWLARNEKQQIAYVQLPAAAYQQSWHGVEVVQTPLHARTEHRDQLLCALAETGVPLSSQLAGEGAATVADLLRTSLREFHLGQEEMSWTTIALALYLPPQTSWRNRFGEEFTFSMLVDAVMAKSLATESCQGTHLMHALTTLLLVDRAMSILDPAQRTALDALLKRRVEQAVASQLADGSWPMRWSDEGFSAARGLTFTSPMTDSQRVTVTGHLLEWFQFLPADMKPPETTMKAGLLWIWQQLRTTPPATLTADFCPFTHAIRALDLAISP